MRFRLIPRDEGFYDLFSDAALNADEGARLLLELLTDLQDIPARVERIVGVERRGDNLTRELLRRLDRAIVTPFDREDIHALAERLDDCVDHIRAAADLVQLHHVDAPLASTVELGTLLVKVSEANTRLFGKLSRLRGLQAEIDEIDTIETEADGAYRRALAQLYSGEFKAFGVLRWQDIVKELEEAIDGFENVSDLVASIAVKHA